MSARYYVIDGRSYPSVTSIIDVLDKPQLLNWTSRVTCDTIASTLYSSQQADSFKELNADTLLAESTARRTQAKNAAACQSISVHRCIASYVSNPCSVTLHRHAAIAAFREWQDAAKFVPLASERLIVSHQYGYAGVADLIGTLDGRLALLDVKTGHSVYPEYRLQLAAYAVAWGEMSGHFPEVCLNLHITRDSTIVEANTFSGAELFSLFQTFLAAKRLFAWRSEHSVSIDHNLTTQRFAVAVSSNRSSSSDTM
ncbi:MAG: PD-(D/E)XK nuclease family protein [Halobacteriota archaeon]